MASIAWWWAIPAAALILAVLWAAWHTRTRRAPGMRETTEHFAQYQAILTRVVESGDGSAARHNPNGPQGAATARRDVP
ncbi:hypothetical protein GCM10023205_08220 [Yinghuangia aomiensis]|uniref:Uncharacterized protein n=1 Tax=Yinghuangia aomiensis TaxID=676205 RepID=A0ABP9GPN5_9ACTN